MSMFIDKRIKVLVQYFNYFTFIFGLQKLKFVNGKIFKIGKFYKVYASIHMIILAYINFCGVRYKYDNKYKNQPVSFVITVIVFYSATITGYIMMLINSVFFSQEIYVKALSTISKANNCLNSEEDDVVNNRNLKKKIIVTHTIYFIFKIIWTIIDYLTFPSPYVIFLQSLMIGLDLEIIHFVMELNIVMRLLEKVNSELKKFSTCPIDIKSGILYEIWSKKKIKTNSIPNDKTENRLIELLKIYDDLIDIIFHLNSHYKITVYIFLYYYNSKIN